MQTAKNAVASAKETAANIGASAQAGLDKTKATLQEKAEKMVAQHPAEKDMAEEYKDEKFHEAEMRKRETLDRNRAAKEHALAGSGFTSTAAGKHQARTASSTVPGGEMVEEGGAASRPIGLATGTGRPAAAHNPNVEGTEPALRGTGGRYTLLID